MLGFEDKSISPRFQQALSDYLRQILHADPRVEPYEKARLPPYLKETYSLYEAQLGTLNVIFAASADAGRPVKGIAADLDTIRKFVSPMAMLVYAAPDLNPLRRNRLVAQGIPFVSPGSQLYLPQAFIDMRERFRNHTYPVSEEKALSPTGQAILFLHLLGKIPGKPTTPQLKEMLRISIVGVLRGFDNLESLGLASNIKMGRNRTIRFESDGRELLHQAERYLRKPVRTVKYVFGTSVDYQIKFGGETALARIGNLTPPVITTYAIAADNWKAVRKRFGWAEVPPGEASFMVESWSYDPDKLSDRPEVDRLSLYAQFRDHPDERISEAATDILKGIFR